MHCIALNGKTVFRYRTESIFTLPFRVMNRLVPRNFASFGIVAAFCFGSFSRVTGAEEIDFSEQVLPILSENCFHCHGPDAGDRKGGLRLDLEDGAKSKLKSGSTAIVPGQLDASELVARILSTDPDDRMPPPDSGKRLSSSEKSRLRQWIAQGAGFEAHWAFLPIKDEPPPAATNDKTATEIDRFIIEKLAQKQLTLSPPASRWQLIRRAAFDLTGLPPTQAEVNDFSKDTSPDAFEKVVDRLLQSPAYGEHWGRHWLDLARYADTHGASAIGFKRFPFSYTYRDYVIAAFNADLPYDRFVLEQIAADQLGLPENDPALAALGFLSVGRRYRNVHDRIDDQIDVISRGLLGLTVSCARCHDHKFDPIPTTDYYRLHAALATSREPAELPLVGNPKIADSYSTQLETREQLRDDIVWEQGEVMRGRLRMQTGLYLRELAKGTPEIDTTTNFLSYRTDDLRPVILEKWRAYLKSLDENDPVFGPWHRLAKLDASTFQKHCGTMVEKMIEENGDPKKFADEHRIGTKPPRWNPRVLEALRDRKPASFVEVADVYGSIFTNTHRNWMTSLLAASEEAAPGSKVIPDQDARHRVVNSAIERQIRRHLYHADSPTAITFEDAREMRMLNRGIRDAVRGTLGSIHNLNLTAQAPPRSMILREKKEPNREARVFLRGNPLQRGERVSAGFLTALSKDTDRAFSPGQHRLGLAKAIVDPANSLTRRVVANWVWQHHFGRGLVRTSDDFGTRGDPPTHPKLLDYLAAKLLEDGWSLKKLHRRIMLSKVYQQGSLENSAAREKDPLNALLWRMPVRKLGLEAMRDALLFVSGEMDERRGGQPFEEKGNRVVPRRSVYAFVNRDVISPMAATFDGADPSACTVKRQETMVPQQALFALNSDFIRGRARALMELPEITSAKSEEEKVRGIYRRIYARPPHPEEVALSLSYINEGKNREADVWAHLVHALLAANEFHFID